MIQLKTHCYFFKSKKVQLISYFFVILNWPHSVGPTEAFKADVRSKHWWRPASEKGRSNSNSVKATTKNSITRNWSPVKVSQTPQAMVQKRHMHSKKKTIWKKERKNIINWKINRTLYFVLFKGGLISESLSLWLKYPKIGAKSLPWAYSL